MGSIKAENRTKEDTTTIIIYENGEFVSPVEDAPVTVVAPKEGETAVAEESGEKSAMASSSTNPGTIVSVWLWAAEW